MKTKYKSSESLSRVLRIGDPVVKIRSSQVYAKNNILKKDPALSIIKWHVGNLIGIRLTPNSVLQSDLKAI